MLASTVLRGRPTTTPQDRQTCRAADWRNDEPGANKPEDCDAVRIDTGHQCVAVPQQRVLKNRAGASNIADYAAPRAGRGRNEMPAASLDELIGVESRLTRSFMGYLFMWLATGFWTIFIAKASASGGVEPSWVALVLLVLQVGFYIWYAVSVGAAAKVLGSPRWRFVLWILVTPLLSLVPIPIISTLIAASPLSIKFLLGGQLQTAIRENTFAEFHRGS